MLSLLIVSISLHGHYYFIVFIGVVTTVMLQDLHFESQPSHTDSHAMMSVTRAAFYVIGIQIYSLALIALGASYKYMLDLFNWEYSAAHVSTDCTGHRLLRFLEGAAVGGDCPDQVVSLQDCPSRRLLRFLNVDSSESDCTEEGTDAHNLVRLLGNHLLSGSVVNPYDLEVSESGTKLY